MTGPGSPATPSIAGPAVRRSRLRNPYLWGAIGGVILITAMRPLTRHIPPPPPTTGATRPFVGLDASGRQFDSSQLHDRVYLASFVGPTCDGDCAARVAALVGLQRRCQRMGVKLGLVTFSLDSDPGGADRAARAIAGQGGDLEHWVVLAGSTTVMQRVLEEGMEPPIRAAMAARPQPAGDWSSWAVLVDGDGQTRGAYPATESGLYEVFHRAQRVMSLRRAWR